MIQALELAFVEGNSSHIFFLAPWSARQDFLARMPRWKKSVSMPSSRRTSLCSRTTTLDWRIGYISTLSTPGLGFLARGPPCAKLRNAKCADAEGASWSATALPEGMVPIGLRAVALAKKLCHVEQINDMAGKNINNALMVHFFPWMKCPKTLILVLSPQRVEISHHRYGTKKHQ